MVTKLAISLLLLIKKTQASLCSLEIMCSCGEIVTVSNRAMSN